MSGSNKMLVLGIDAASPALLRSWAADGTLPNIARLLATGLVVDTRGAGSMYIGIPWPCFYTGLNPAGHGIYWIDQLEPGTYRSRPPRPADFGRRKALWDVLSDAGRRVLVLDVPLSRLSPDLNGAQVIEWGTHDVLFGFQTSPPELKARILQSVGEHPAPTPCDTPRRSLEQYDTFTGQLVQGAAMRARVTRELLATESWDFAIQVFNEAHCAGHQLWHYHDPAHPAFDAATTSEHGDLIRNVYAAIDAAIGDILNDVGPDTTVVLLSLHDMSYMCGGSGILREILTRLGVFSPPSLRATTMPATPTARLIAALRALYHRVPEFIRRPLYNLRAHVGENLLGAERPLDFDPATTKCFPVETGPSIGGVRLNLRGREPQGTLSRGAEADAFCAELSRQLLEVTRADTGRPLARRVIRVEDMYHGAYVDNLPDLFVEFDLQPPLGSTVVGNGEGAVVCARSPRIGEVEFVNRYCRTGEHRAEGLFIVRGPGLSPGQLGRAVSTFDLAPTLAAMLGCAMPGTDGAVIPELLSS